MKKTTGTVISTTADIIYMNLLYPVDVAIPLRHSVVMVTNLSKIMYMNTPIGFYDEYDQFTIF